MRALNAIIEAERQSITELQAELERHRDALREISKRLEAMTTDKPAVAESRAEKAETQPPRFDFYGETILRLDNLRQSYPGCSNCPARNRERFRIRLGTEGRLAPGLRVVAGLGVGELNDPNSTFQTLGGEFSRKAASWERAYIEYSPVQAKWMQMTAGKFPYTWLRSTMTFDVDIFPEGASERFSFNLHHSGALKNISIQGLQLIAHERAAGSDALITGGQGTILLNPAKRVSTVVAFTGLNFKNPEHVLRSQLSGTDAGTQVTNAFVTRGGDAFYASRFLYANTIVENTIQTGIESMPITAAFEYQRNLRAASSRDSGVSLRVEMGRREKRGDWGFGWHVFRVEQDAILSAFGESDWRAPSNVIQHRFSLTRMVHPNVMLGWTWYRGRTLDLTLSNAVLAPGLKAGQRDPWTNRMYLDAIYRF